MPPIEAVLVDVGGVLVLPDHDRVAGALERAGVHVDRSRLDRAHYAGVAALTEFSEGDREVWAAYNRAYARACGTPDDALDEAVEHLLNEFATGEVWSRTVPGSVDALRVPAAHAVHVGDTPGADVDGARAAGVHPVLVDPYDFHADLDVERVAALAEVVELVRDRQPA